MSTNKVNKKGWVRQLDQRKEGQPIQCPDCLSSDIYLAVTRGKGVIPYTSVKCNICGSHARIIHDR